MRIFQVTCFTEAKNKIGLKISQGPYRLVSSYFCHFLKQQLPRPLNTQCVALSIESTCCTLGRRWDGCWIQEGTRHTLRPSDTQGEVDPRHIYTPVKCHTREQSQHSGRVLRYSVCLECVLGVLVELVGEMFTESAAPAIVYVLHL